MKAKIIDDRIEICGMYYPYKKVTKTFFNNKKNL